MTTSRLAKDRLARLHDIMARHVDRGAAPGLVFLGGAYAAIDD